jgi:glucose/arabinose dehydrogenase
VLAITKETADHNGGMMQFGPDGYLYVSVGDGGADPPRVPVGRYGQTLGDLLGTILRIDPRGAAPYAVPPGNPFVAMESARPEIVAYGLRNPWRFWIDPATSAMLIGDVGEGAREEIDRLPLDRLGANFGWPCKEGSVVPPKVASRRSAADAAARSTRTGRRVRDHGGAAHDPRIAALGGLYRGPTSRRRVNGLTPQGKVVPLDHVRNRRARHGQRAHLRDDSHGRPIPPRSRPGRVTVRHAPRLRVTSVKPRIRAITRRGP